jgi:hypothetical protein
VHAAAATVAERLPAGVGSIEALDERTCVVDLGSDNVELLAVWLGALDADFTVGDAPELVAHLRVLADRYARAASG